MNNELFLKQNQNLYESLRYFNISENILFLNYQGTYSMPFKNILLSNLNPNLFLLKPNEIFHILRALELLYKNDLTENDIDFLNNYVKTYLNLNDISLDGNTEYINELNGFKIPIYLSYDPFFIENPTSKIIQEKINNHSAEIESGKSKHPRLVLMHPNLPSEDNDDNLLISQAGFSTLILIFLTVAATCLYIYQYILGN